jgi:hypothetical protein
MPPVGVPESSGFIPEIFLGTALGRLRNYLTLQRTATMDKDLKTGESFNVGQVLHLPKRGALVANRKTDTGNYSVQNPQSSTVDVTLNNQWEVTFGLTSQAIAFQNQDQTDGYIEDAIIALAEQIDTDLFQAYKLIAAANTVTNGGNITEANILSARKILRDQKVRPGAKQYGVVSTTQEAAILQLANLVRYDAIGVSNNVSNAKIGDGAVVMPGAIGRAYGFEICPSQLVPSVAANDNTLQTITVSGAPTGGSFTITINSLTTGPIAYNASAAAVKSALNALTGFGGQVYVTKSGSVWTVAFLNGNTFAMTTTDSLTGGSTPATAVAQVAQTTGAKNLFYSDDFFLMAFRPLPLPEAGQGAVGTYMMDPETGIGMRLVKSWNTNQGSSQITLDCLYGLTAMRAEHGVLVQTA